MQATNRTVIS